MKQFVCIISLVLIFTACNDENSSRWTTVKVNVTNAYTGLPETGTELFIQSERAKGSNANYIAASGQTNNNGFLEVNSTFQQTCNMPYRNGSVVNFTSPPLQPDPRAIDCAVTISLNDNYCSNLQSHYGSGAFETSMLWTNTVLIATSLLFLAWLYRAPFRIFVFSLVPPTFVAAYYLAAMYIALEQHVAYFTDGVMTKTLVDELLSLLRVFHCLHMCVCHLKLIH